MPLAFVGQCHVGPELARGLSNVSQIGSGREQARALPRLTFSPRPAD